MSSLPTAAIVSESFRALLDALRPFDIFRPLEACPMIRHLVTLLGWQHWIWANPSITFEFACTDEQRFRQIWIRCFGGVFATSSPHWSRALNSRQVQSAKLAFQLSSTLVEEP